MHIKSQKIYILKLEINYIINVKVFEYVNIRNSNIRIGRKYSFLNTFCVKHAFEVNILNTCFRYFKYLF